MEKNWLIKTDRSGVERSSEKARCRFLRSTPFFVSYGGALRRCLFFSPENVVFAQTEATPPLLLAAFAAARAPPALVKMVAFAPPDVFASARCASLACGPGGHGEST